MKNIITLIISGILLSCAPGDTTEEIFQDSTDKIENHEVKNSSFDYGNAKSGIYTNDYFNFEIKFDTSWSIQSQKQLNGIVEQGKRMLNNNSALEKAIEAAEINTAYLFAMFKHEMGAPVSFNPSLIILAENTKRMKGVKQGKDYLFHARENLEQTKLNYTFDQDYASKKYAAYNFDILTAHLNGYTTPITQKYITTVIGNFTLSFIISYSTEEEKQELYQVLESMKKK